jgi:hypothetical protein
VTAPLIHLAGDTPRAGRNDPEASHVAADRSSRTRNKIANAVLEILAADGPMTGGEMNEAYRIWRESNPRTFPMCHFDSPRKRLGELAEDALADVISHRHKTVEAVYKVSPEGLRMLGVSE